jgi:hypothetical protein
VACEVVSVCWAAAGATKIVEARIASATINARDGRQSVFESSIRNIAL